MTRNDAVGLQPLTHSDLRLARAEEDVRGRKVFDRDGFEIGRVDEVIVDTSERRARFIRVRGGDFAGIDGTVFPIPVDAISRLRPDRVDIHQTRERVRGAPKYDPTLRTDRGYYAGLYGWYGYMPFWVRARAVTPTPRFAFRTNGASFAVAQQRGVRQSVGISNRDGSGVKPRGAPRWRDA